MLILPIWYSKTFRITRTYIWYYPFGILKHFLLPEHLFNWVISNRCFGNKKCFRISNGSYQIDVLVIRNVLEYQLGNIK
jgi:hypothetical protein